MNPRMARRTNGAKVRRTQLERGHPFRDTYPVAQAEKAANQKHSGASLAGTSWWQDAPREGFTALAYVRFPEATPAQPFTMVMSANGKFA